jgi:shikimate O-hydroxycinnamoyltransferase
MHTLTLSPDRQTPGATICSHSDWLLRFNTVSIAFSYRERLDFERLGGALRCVLGDFPAYAGRLVTREGKLHIEHGAGIRLERAASDEGFEALAAAAQTGRAHLLCPSMSVRRALGGNEALLAVRLTETRDGCVLGVTWHHSVGDLQSTMSLLRACARAYGNAPHDVPPLVLDRVEYLDRRVPDPANAVSSLRLFSAGELWSVAGFIAQRKRRVDFEFSWDELAEIHQRLVRDEFLSPHDALCAHAFSALRGLKSERPPERVVLVVNYRKRVGLAPNLLGNMLGAVVVTADARCDAVTIASELRAALNAYGSQHVDYHPTRRFLARHPGRLDRIRSMPSFFDAGGGTCIVTNWTNFGVYELAFDGVAPALFSSLTRAPVPWIANVFESPNQRGVTLSMFLPTAFAKRVDSPEGRMRMHAGRGQAYVGRASRSA